ncbi:hypothetical protein JCM14036_32260 [Desulfotomaculum defluvii]
MIANALSVWEPPALVETVKMLTNPVLSREKDLQMQIKLKSKEKRVRLVIV